ncbi:6-phosphogluconolactonase [Candidatus Nitrosacidococcus tergens]|uniref:6-phosphogluconolactonase n=1 Tax=Candidatus Nitrosacidococcus tergens TaxID=553981 RepID=A0A7G1Q9I5_9GAMM|nr:6-phosphogluconolactonase [Candidatus Nitrosacidococcus tergens]CAB1275987.1 6-phosphogluconolactonase [Candidatus Nitrosacidococcus tergens]
MDRIRVFPTQSDLYQGAADYWKEVANSAISQKGSFHVALSGGNTPKGLYKLLASTPYIDEIDWTRVYIYFGDERYVPMDDKDSNYRMARESFLDQIPTPPYQVFRIPTEDPNPQVSANSYAELLKNYLPDNKFDLILLGVGADGHTASLFPHTSILEIHDRLVAAVYVEKLSTWRVSITYPLIEQAHQVLFLAAGIDKSPVIANILKNPEGRDYPIQLLLQAKKEVFWYLDKQAAQVWENKQ